MNHPRARNIDRHEIFGDSKQRCISCQDFQNFKLPRVSERRRTRVSK
jgi:hypothetical protein